MILGLFIGAAGGVLAISAHIAWHEYRVRAPPRSARSAQHPAVGPTVRLCDHGYPPGARYCIACGDERP